MSPNSNRADSSVLEETAYGARWGNVVRFAVLSGGLLRDAEAEVVAVAVAAVVAAAVIVVAVDTEGSQTLRRCGWVLVAYPGRQDSGETSNDKRRTLMQEIRGKHHGKPRQPGR